MFPIDFEFNGIKVKVIDCQYVNLVLSITIAWLGSAFSDFIQTLVIQSRCSLLIFWFNTLKIKVTVTFNEDTQFVNIVRSVTRVWLGPAFLIFRSANI